MNRTHGFRLCELRASVSALVRSLAPALAFVLSAAALSAQTAEEPQAAPPASASVVAPAPEPGLYVGPATCASATCHGATEPRNVFGVLQNEYLTWLQRDRHSKSQQVLYNPQSRKIAENLGLDRPAAETPLCLDCHAFTPPPERVSGKLELEDGISCEACHGPASGWLGPHTEEGWKREDGVAAGLIDLSDPVRRGELCLSCHRGEADRVVDHPLLAAGHPPLAFELDNFSADMPAHWRPDPVADGVRGWAVGQVVALRQELDLVITTAGSGHWPELSLMTCGDCHHSLEEERWRRPGARSPLGLPRWSPARWAVLRHLVRRFAPEHEAPLDRALGRFARTVAQLGTPPAEAIAAARDARQAVDGVIPTLRDAEWSERQVTALLVSLADDRGALAAAGRDTAQQAFLAVNTLASDLIQRHPQVLRGGLIDAVEALYRTVQSPYRFDSPGFAAGLERLGREVRRLR